MNQIGTFVISLDFELNWGVFDVLSLEQYKENLLGAREIIPMMLKRFERHHVKATWGIVGFLFFDQKKDLLHALPKMKPSYNNKAMCPYRHMKSIGENELEDPFHFGASLIEQIKACKSQEIATHTFCHYYCLEEGQTMDEFEEDLRKAIEIAEQKGIQIKTLISPRNQLNVDYLPVLKKYGITTYRGNENHWLYRMEQAQEGILKRGIRLLDSYINISGHHVYRVEDLMQDDGLFNVPSSRFLRPYTSKLSFLDSFKVRRILSGMTKAAKEKKVYHLWWHPHNFGTHIDENMQLLDVIINHYLKLKRQYGMESLTMNEVSEKVNQLKLASGL